MGKEIEYSSPDSNAKVIIVEPDITQEENERRLKRVEEVLARIAQDMIKNKPIDIK